VAAGTAQEPVIAVLCQKALRCLLEQADSLESQPEQHAPDEPMDWLSLTDDVFLRSCTSARWQLGIPLPVEP
jgi:hypothetical protein